MKHFAYFIFGLILVSLVVSLSILFFLATEPLVKQWVDFLFDNFDSSAGYFGPLLCAPVLVVPMLVACYYIGRHFLGEEK